MPQAVVLVGGSGARLRSVSGDLPKPMVPVCGRPFLHWLLVLLRERGIDEVLLLTGHRAEVIHDYVDATPLEGLTVRCSAEREPLGTGGALRAAAALLDRCFLLLYGDTYLDIEFGALHAEAARAGAIAHMVVGEPELGEGHDPGNVELDDAGWVTTYRKHATPPLPYIDAGVSAWQRDVLVEHWPEQMAFSLEHVVLPELVRGRKLRGWKTQSRFYDIGTPARLQRFEHHLAGTR